MRLSCVIINMIYQIHLDFQKYSFLATSLKLVKTKHTYFCVRRKNWHLNAIASMLFEASSCSIFVFQCSIFDSAIFIILFFMLNLQ